MRRSLLLVVAAHSISFWPLRTRINRVAGVALTNSSSILSSFSFFLMSSLMIRQRSVEKPVTSPSGSRYEKGGSASRYPMRIFAVLAIRCRVSMSSAAWTGGMGIKHVSKRQNTADAFYVLWPVAGFSNRFLCWAKGIRRRRTKNIGPLLTIGGIVPRFFRMWQAGRARRN